MKRFGKLAIFLATLVAVAAPLAVRKTSDNSVANILTTAPVLADDEGADLERQWTTQNYNRIVKSVGYPDTSNALVKKQLRLIYELTDRGTDTYTYHRIQLTGELRGICDSIGYPSAYSTQYSRPEETYWNGSWRVILPQAEPDGTYKPGSHSATYYLCKGENGIYLEYAEEFIHASSQKKVTVADDKIIEESQPILTYQELQQMKELEGEALTQFLEAVADRLESNVGQ